jgi:hypothetical protein
MTTRDFFLDRKPDSPGQGSVTITPSSDELDPIILSLYCTGAGDVTFVGADGSTDTWTVPANFIIPIAMKAVTAATATGLKGIR